MYTTKSLQRGFTEKSAPLNAAFILEEARRESWDENNPFILRLQSLRPVQSFSAYVL
jgi:hypothetical protein